MDCSEFHGLIERSGVYWPRPPGECAADVANVIIDDADMLVRFSGLTREPRALGGAVLGAFAWQLLLLL